MTCGPACEIVQGIATRLSDKGRSAGRGRSARRGRHTSGERHSSRGGLT